MIDAAGDAAAGALPRPEPRQLALELPHATGLGLADFLPAASNRAAFDAVLRWPDWPAAVLVLSGPPASGRTHLARIWQARSRAAFLTGDQLCDLPHGLRALGEARHLALDDADRIGDEPLLFHLHNAVLNRGGSLLLTSGSAPAAWPVALPDLRSRLLAAWPVQIEPPDDSLLSALLVKQFADRQLRVEPAVIDYLLPRLERSFSAMRRVVDGLDRVSLRAQRPVTLHLVRALLAHEPEPVQRMSE